MNVYFDTYGCAANRAHSEVMKGLLLRSGCDLVEDEERADVVVLNSCIVKSPTENRIIHRLKEWKKKENVKTILAGCMPKAEYERAREFAPDASFVGPNNCRDITKAVRNTAQGEKVELLDERREDRLCMPRVRENKIVDICEIAQGCSGDCSYCQVKRAKGGLKSYDPEKITEEIKRSLNAGCVEVWVTAQDTAAYGRDLGTTLPELLQRITDLPGNFRVRVGMMNPDTLKPIMDSLVEVFKDDKIYSFLHLPLQSGSDGILKKMNRDYTVEEWKDVVKKFRNEIPDLNLWTDVIVGFPGETEEDFKKTKEILEEIKPDTVNVSRFGARPNTEAKEMEGQVSTETKKERSKEVSELVERISEEKKKRLTGERREVLITERGKEKDQWKGRDGSYRQALVHSKEGLLGRFVDVKADRVESGNIYCEVEEI